MINTKFWSDTFVVDLKPIERYLFLYFLTNEHTNISGIYELSVRTMAFETKLSKKALEEALEGLNGKVYYFDGWIYIKNFQKHQSTTSKQVQAGIVAEMGKVPEGIKRRIEGIDTLSDPLIYLNSNLNPNSNPNPNLNTPYSTEAAIFNQELFKYFKDLTGNSPTDEPKTRQRYPAMIRKKWPQVLIVKAAMNWGWNLFDKKNQRFYWRECFTLRKLYHDIIPKYQSKVDGEDGLKKLADMKRATLGGKRMEV